MVGENWIENRKYTYRRELKWPVEAIDIHHVVVRRSRASRFFIYVCLVIGLSNAVFLVLSKHESVTILFWSFILSASLLKLFLWKPVKQALGVQLETHFLSGRTTRRFFPIGKILRPVLLECVTPLTCYWSLSLIVRDEGELMLVFKVKSSLFQLVILRSRMELRPPVKMLVPIWKALCATIDCKESPDADDG
ncbi:hypothetical protein WN943_021017 [Citrus x changshan-huyou]